jgi:3-deoxy-D-manno-octulosonic-acid transferase
MRVWRHSAAFLSAALGAPVGLAALALRPRWRDGWRERVGLGAAAASGAIWVHASSVGEILAAGRLMDHLAKAGQRVLASTSTLSGRDVMRGVRPEVPCRLAPVDHPWAVDAALSRVSPRALVLVETEIWPIWIAAAARRDIPVMLVSGRVSDRSFPRYRKLGRIVSDPLQCMAAIGARTAGDAERLVQLGADPGRVVTTGDLKLEHDETRLRVAPDLERALGPLPLVVAGSTHKGEEKAVLAALRAVENAGLRARLVIAPRQLERTSEVRRLVRAAGRKVRRRSKLGESPLADDAVLVLDTLGELSALYDRARVAFVGGSLVSVGGHNVLEPALSGCPVVFGRHTANVRHAVEILEACGAGWQVSGTDDLARAFTVLLRDPEAARARGEAGIRALAHHRGSAARAAALILANLEARVGEAAG